MTNSVWYYEYSIKLWNEVDTKFELCSGVVPAESLIEVVTLLEDYYGKNIEEIQLIRPIFEGPVLDFKEYGFTSIIQSKVERKDSDIT